MGCDYGEGLELSYTCNIWRFPVSSNQECLIPDDVLPPEDKQEKKEEPAPGTFCRYERAFGPIVGGLIIDLMDLATFGLVGIMCGLLVGAAAGFWVASISAISAVAGVQKIVYCTIPFTEIFPVATLIGAYARFNSSERKTKSGDDNE
ncbi:hypothetical protein ACFLS1_04415 [Verrucomicrobiota bacterium]